MQMWFQKYVLQKYYHKNLHNIITIIILLVFKRIQTF